MRAMVAYGIVIVCLYRRLRGRSFREVNTLLWQAPIAYTAVSTALLGALLLAVEDAARVGMSDEREPAFSTENGS